MKRLPDFTETEAGTYALALEHGVTGYAINTPPGTPAHGDAYIVGTNPVGAWTGRGSCIAVYDTSAWSFIPASGSMGAAHRNVILPSADGAATYKWLGASWTSWGAPGQLAGHRNTYDPYPVYATRDELAGITGGATAWGSITGTLSNQTDLNTALGGKAASSHNHIIGDTTGLQTALDGKSATGHSHAISDTTGLQTALDGKQAAGSYAAASHTHAQSDITNLTTDLAGKAAASHTHNASDINAGTVATARLGSGTANSSTYLRGDQTWASVAANLWTTVFATDDQAVTNSAVLTDSTYLQFTTTANTSYHIRLRILANTTSASADFKYRLTHAGTTTRVFRVRTYSVPAGTSATYPTVVPATAFDSADQTLLNTSAGDMVIYEDIYLRVGASGGVLKFAFAQNTQTASQSVTVYEGSYLEYATT